MKIELTDGERLVASYLIASLNGPPQGQGLDLAGARIVAGLQDALSLRQLTIERDDQADVKGRYELEQIGMEWMRDEIDRRARERSIPARFAKYVVMLHDRLRNSLDGTEKEQERT